MKEVIELEQEDINWAYHFWFGSYIHRHIDRDIEKCLRLGPQHNQWIISIRKAKYLSAREVAERLKISPPAYYKLEKGEVPGSTTIQSMRNIAKALECEFVYGFRPRSGELLSKPIWEKLAEVSKDHHWVKTKPKHLKARALASIAKLKFADPKIKKKLLQKTEGALNNFIF